MIESIERIKLLCPFCHKKTIDAIYCPNTFQTRKTTSSTGTTTKVIKGPTKYEIESGCSNCGKSQKEIKKVMKEGGGSISREKKVLERLKKAGLDREMTTKF